MEMGSEEEKWEKLDAEFDHFVVDMKPFVLKLPHRSERQRCALWIRKLCEPSGTGTGIPGRKNRNLYAKLLLHMLRRGVLEGPFTQRPEPGTLRALPSYMSIYFDEPNPAQATGSSPDGLPAWVAGELGSSEHRRSESRELSSGEDYSLVQSPTDLDMKTKLMEAKYHEEKLKLQQKHDADVQKILERKNNEIEEMKTLYKKKQSETEETIRKLEKKVQTLVRECQVIRETKDNQIAELKKICEQSTESLNNDWEKKLHNAVAEMEKEKFELQKRHTENIQDLLEDTNVRLNKMEGEYVAQTQCTNQMIKELESRVQQLTGEAENSNLQKQKLIQEKLELERCYQITCNELQEVKARRNTLHKEKDHLISDYEQNLKLLQTKYDADVNLLKKEHALSASKVVEKEEQLTRVSEGQRLQAQQADAALEEFKRQVELNSEKVYAEMKEQMEKVEADLTRSKSLREKQSKEFLWQLDDVKQRYEQQIVELKLEHEQEKTHLLQQHNAETESLVRDHEREVGDLESQLRAANMEHENQIQEFKKRDSQITEMIIDKNASREGLQCEYTRHRLFFFFFEGIFVVLRMSCLPCVGCGSFNDNKREILESLDIQLSHGESIIIHTKLFLENIFFKKLLSISYIFFFTTPTPASISYILKNLITYTKISVDVIYKRAACVQWIQHRLLFFKDYSKA
ncbi:hypothetical protein FD754_004899 [Muntiacus muntjak]|uniref:DUF4485 domain-containing protein n=1 Tax=Muntiacus muntjak TaxID=9888 RepID=A0A5N3WGX6_MUNMU|nr:hypothetical protein FD754_004899 [Muntiacus muntjak]